MRGKKGGGEEGREKGRKGERNGRTDGRTGRGWMDRDGSGKEQTKKGLKDA